MCQLTVKNHLRLSSCLVAVSLAVWFLSTGDVSRAEEVKKQATSETIPKWPEIQRVITAAMANRSATEILSRGDISKLFAKLEKSGWKLADRKAIENQILSDSDFLVRQLRTKAGRQFMQRIGKHTGAYDRLDRLRMMPYGPRRIRELIRGPDGYKLIEYMTTTRQGKNLGRQLSRGVNGKSFNQPTGRIYTSRQLTAALQRLHKASLAQSQPMPRKTPRKK